MPETIVALLLHETEHVPPPGHPENADRLQLIANAMAQKVGEGAMGELAIRPYGRNVITRVHTDSYVREVESGCQNQIGSLDPDTYLSQGSFLAACRVVEASLSGVDALMESRETSVFVLGRPPGHHALAHRAMGFCLFNNAAIAAQYAIDRHHLSRVAIVDFDVHHGNGTQAIFYDRKDVLYCSTHRAIFYPGTGFPEENGSAAGRGFTINRPLMAGDGDREMVAAHRDSFIPALDQFRPELIIVSAGFDAHRRDPLGGLSVTGSGYREIGRMIAQTARTHCQGRVLSVLEGGYDAHGNLESITSYLEGLADYE